MTRAISFQTLRLTQNSIRQCHPFGGHLAQNSARAAVFCHGRFQTVRGVTSVLFMLVAFESCHVSIPQAPAASAAFRTDATCYVAGLVEIDHFS
jgi:hypothetical protein